MKLNDMKLNDMLSVEALVKNQTNAAHFYKRLRVDDAKQQQQQQQQQSELLVAYVDGSFYSDAKCAGAAVWFREDCYFNNAQYMRDDFEWGTRSALRAEMYAALLAVRIAINMARFSLLIAQDCKQASSLLSRICVSSELPVHLVEDKLLVEWWRCCQYVDVRFKWVAAHQEEPEKNNLAEWHDWHGNAQADAFAKRAANMSRYREKALEMDRNNPLYRQLPELLLPRVASWTHLYEYNVTYKVAYDTTRRIETMPLLTDKYAAVEDLAKEVLVCVVGFQDLRMRLIRLHSPRSTLFRKLV